MNATQARVVQTIALGTLEAIKDGGATGGPAGVIYAAMMAHGASLNQFQSLMQGMVSNALVTLDDQDCYHLTDKGTQTMASLQAKLAA